jgi:TatD DNase family protein
MLGLVIDAHTHLLSLEDPEDAILRAGQAGVCGMVSIGTSPDNVAATLALAEKHPEAVRVGVGVHPHEAQAFDHSEWSRIEQYARSPHACAIGETGFDQYRDHGPIEFQHRLFERHAQLAREVELPLVIHTRDADQITLDALAEHADGVEVVLHCFSMPERIDEVLERGYWISFAGNMTYRSAEDLRAAARKVPAERLLVETDAPYLTPVPHRGKKNQPAYVVHTADALAVARGEDANELKQQLTDNATRLFGFAGVRIL